MTPLTDLDLSRVLAPAPRPPDEAFVLRVTQAVAAEERLRAAERRWRRRFAWDAAACAAVLMAFLALGLIRPAGPSGAELQPFSPAMIGLVLLALWATLSRQPAGAGPARRSKL
jgi:hypothetical protein